MERIKKHLEGFWTEIWAKMGPKKLTMVISDMRPLYDKEMIALVCRASSHHPKLKNDVAYMKNKQASKQTNKKRVTSRPTFRCIGG